MQVHRHGEALIASDRQPQAQGHPQAVGLGKRGQVGGRVELEAGIAKAVLQEVGPGIVQFREINIPAGP